MKNPFLLFATALVITACTKPQPVGLTDTDKEQIRIEILELTTQWAMDNSKMDAAAASEFWADSPEMCHAENGIFFTNPDTVYGYLNNFYSNTDSMHVVWTERIISPLTNDIALMKGFFHFRAVFKSGDMFEGEPAFTGVFVRKEGKWALLQGHESFAMH
jgi:hypothetical protein